MTTQHDLFGAPTGSFVSSRDVPKIPGNETLERACVRLLGIIRENPALIDGDSIRTVDSQLYAELLWRDCFEKIVSPDKKAMFFNAMKKAPEPELFTRARRELQQRDLIRLSSAAIKRGEMFRNKISGAMGGND